MTIDARSIVTMALPVALVAGLLVRGAFVHGQTPMPEITLHGHGQPEGCLRCHADLRGLGVAHDPAAFGCSPCHLGDPVALDKVAAHRGMVVLAGELSVAPQTCGRSDCHTDELRRVNTSVMAGAPGILAVDRYVFGERDDPTGTPGDDLRRLDPLAPPASPAESHVRKLCASCHIGMHKSGVGDQGFFSRGGGCMACHLGPPRGGGAGQLHPDITARVSENRCEGCHARSGRISLSYHGKLEVEENDPRRNAVLPDGRPIAPAEPDVHAKAGMSCMDCHTERGLMGDGTPHLHGYQAVDIACEDCHAPARTGPSSAEQTRVAGVLAASWARDGRPPLSPVPRTTRSGTPLWRTDAWSWDMLLHDSGQSLTIPAATDAAYHRLPGHERLSCQACHTVWAPRCTKCHTELRPNGTQIDHLSGQLTSGEWIETAGGNGGGSPLLALGPQGRIVPFVEGMVLRIDGAGAPIDGSFWAPLDPHTTGKSRSCASCHGQDATATYPSVGHTTRTGARLLDPSERSRIERVGRCITCHPGYDDIVYEDFTASVKRLADRTDKRVAKCRGAVD